MTVMTPDRSYEGNPNPGFQPRTSPVVSGDAKLMEMEQQLAEIGSRTGGSPAYWAMANRVKQYRLKLQQDAAAGNAFADQEEERRRKGKTESQLDADRAEAEDARAFERKRQMMQDARDALDREEARRERDAQRYKPTREETNDAADREDAKRERDYQRERQQMQDARDAADREEAKRARDEQRQEEADRKRFEEEGTPYGNWKTKQRPGQASPIMISPGQQQPPQGNYGGRIGADPNGTFFLDFIDKDKDGIDDRWQSGPGQPDNRGPRGGYESPSPRRLFKTPQEQAQAYLESAAFRDQQRPQTQSAAQNQMPGQDDFGNLIRRLSPNRSQP